MEDSSERDIFATGATPKRANVAGRKVKKKPGLTKWRQCHLTVTNRIANALLVTGAGRFENPLA
ncbi:hypothetical protein JCM15519_14350 [Fundidesulfovibrio butyratiphilus]